MAEAHARFLEMALMRIRFMLANLGAASLLPVYTIFLLDLASGDWGLAASSFLLTGLYIYTYNFLEGKFLKTPKSEGSLPYIVYLNRWLFFGIFRSAGYS